MAAVRAHSSAAGALSLLSEPEPVIQEHALRTLVPLVANFWAEISEHIAQIESLYENEALSRPARDAAALLASKVYYSLGEYDDALSFALGAGQAFADEVRTRGSEEYVETVVSKAIDRYIALRAEDADGKDAVDPRLQAIIENIFQRCIDDGEYKQAIGIAIEARRLDVVRRVYERTRDAGLLAYALDAAADAGVSLAVRDAVLRFLLPLFPPPGAAAGPAAGMHAHALTRLLVTLADPAAASPLLRGLVEKDKLLAYQFAFDLVEGGAQDFLETVRNDLPQDGEHKEVYDQLRDILTGQESVKLHVEFLKRNNRTDMLILKHTKDSLEARSSLYHTALTLQNAFAHAGTTSDVFLRENLEWLGLAANWSKFTATAALGVIHRGWFEQAMTILGPYLPQQGGAPAGGGIQGAAFSEGGALYALGLIHAGCGAGRSVDGYLRDTLRAAQSEVVQHGAALGLGIAGMGGRSMDAYEDLKQTLFTDSAVAGEAAGYAMGLVLLGSAHAEAAEEMLGYARETAHEKIIRGLALGLAFVYYGRQEEADAMVKTLLEEKKDPILRYGGVYTLALAYAGTADNTAVRKLLHIAVSDTSDDVRRAAVTSLAFVLAGVPGQVPRIVQLLAESYNPHVRCGATLALGIACAGSGATAAVEILEPLTKDSVDFVRQGALAALGMVLVQQSDAAGPAAPAARATFAKVLADKHEDPLARVGAALGAGLIDAGGRNARIGLLSGAGRARAQAVVGMALFAQFWYWYPLAHCAALAFEPTGIIGLTADLKAPAFAFTSNARPSLFAYPAPTKPTKKEAAPRVAAAVLSTTAKTKAREKKKAAEADAMDTDEKPEAKKDGDVEMKADEPKHGDVSPLAGSLSALPDDGGKPAEGAGRRKEPPSEELQNFARVTPAQLAYISFAPDARYQPVRPVSARAAAAGAGKRAPRAQPAERFAGGGGILLLQDRAPGEPAEYLTFETQLPLPEAAPAEAAGGAPAAGLHIAVDPNEPEAPPPQAFEYPFGSGDA